jgi:hypothetical protein
MKEIQGHLGENFQNAHSNGKSELTGKYDGYCGANPP